MFTIKSAHIGQLWCWSKLNINGQLDYYFMDTKGPSKS